MYVRIATNQPDTIYVAPRVLVFAWKNSSVWSVAIIKVAKPAKPNIGTDVLDESTPLALVAIKCQICPLNRNMTHPIVMPARRRTALTIDFVLVTPVS